MKKKQEKKVVGWCWSLKKASVQPDPVTGHWVLELVSREKDNSKSDESSGNNDEIDEQKQHFISDEGERWLDSLWLE